MSQADSPTSQHVFHVAVHDAHLEFLVDGEGDWFAGLSGVVEQSDHEAVRIGLPIMIRLGGYEPEVRGLHVGSKAASATVAMGAIGIKPLKALITQCRPQGPSLAVEVAVCGEPEARASRPGHVWWFCRAAPKLSNMPTTRRTAPAAPDFDADLRIAVDAGGPKPAEGGASLLFSGPVIASRHDALPQGLGVSIRFDAGADRQMSVGEDQVDITWPLTDVDARGVLEAIKLARAGDVLIDLDMGRLQSDPEPRPWHVTDLAVIAPSVLPGARSRKRPACST